MEDNRFQEFDDYQNPEIKKRTSKAEILLLIIFVIGMTMFLLEWPGASLFLIVSMGILGLMYSYLAFAILTGIGLRRMFKKSNYKGLSALRIVGVIAVGMNLGTVVLGMLFKLMYWPGFAFMILVGTIFLIISSIVILFKFKSDKGFYGNLLKRTLVVIVLGVFLYTVPSHKIVEMRVGKEHPEYIKAIEALEKNPNNLELEKKVQEEYQKMSEKRDKEYEDE